MKTNLLLDRLGVGVGSVLIPEENTDDIVGSTTDVESPPGSAIVLIDVQHLICRLTPYYVSKYYYL